MNACGGIKFAPEPEPHFHRRETASAVGKRHLARYRIEPDNLAIALQRESRLQELLLPIEVSQGAGIVRLGSNAELPNLLKSRDFSHIDQIEDFNRSSLDGDLRIVIDAEISHGMGERGHGTQNQHEQQQSDSRPTMMALIFVHCLTSSPGYAIGR